MSILHQEPYTSVLGDIQVPLNTLPLTSERQLQLQNFFNSYVEGYLTDAEHMMINNEGYCWLALANPNTLTENKIINLRHITMPTVQNPETITCVISGCVHHPEGPVLSYRHLGEETIRYLPRKNSGMYLFKIITDN